MKRLRCQIWRSKYRLSLVVSGILEVSINKTALWKVSVWIIAQSNERSLLVIVNVNEIPYEFGFTAQECFIFSEPRLVPQRQNKFQSLYSAFCSRTGRFRRPVHVPNPRATELEALRHHLLGLPLWSCPKPWSLHSSCQLPGLDLQYSGPKLIFVTDTNMCNVCNT